MPRAIRMTTKEKGKFNSDVFMSAVESASTIEILKFLGDVMRVHKVNKLPHTKDQQFMQRCRVAYSNRQQALLKGNKNGSRVRQQHVGNHQPERAKGKGNASRLPGELRDREQGVLDLGLGQGAQGRDGELS